MAETIRDAGDDVPGNHYDKYHTRNPVARAMMRGFLRSFETLVAASGASSAHEFGCGEGELSIALARRGVTVSGSDVDAPIVEIARGNARAAGADCRFEPGSIYEADRHAIDVELIVCCEVLEHLDDPALALDRLAALNAEHFLFSVPREPLWRALNVARGRYLRRCGNTPGHVQHWSAAGFERLLASRFHVESLRMPLPWTMALCRARRASKR